MTIETMSKRQLQGAAKAALDRMHDAIHRENHVPRHLTQGEGPQGEGPQGEGPQGEGRRAKGEGPQGLEAAAERPQGEGPQGSRTVVHHTS